MKVNLLPLIFFVFLVALIATSLALIDHNTYVIGGKYVVHEGDNVHGNLKLYFAQVLLEKDTLVHGEILSVSSTVDIQGEVTGDLSAIESEVKIGQPANVKVIAKEPDVFPFVILLPEIARWNISIGRDY
jgi:hypothetical protein